MTFFSILQSFFSSRTSFYLICIAYAIIIRKFLPIYIEYNDQMYELIGEGNAQKILPVLDDAIFKSEAEAAKYHELTEMLNKTIKQSKKQ